MRKLAFLIFIFLNLIAARAMAEDFVCQLSVGAQEQAPCLVGDFSKETQNFTDKGEAWNTCKTISDTISKSGESCKITVGEGNSAAKYKTILFKGKGFNVTDLIQYSCQDLNGEQTANCLNNNQIGNNGASHSITTTTTINDSVIIAGYDVLFQHGDNEWCLGQGTGTTCGKTLAENAASEIKENTIKAKTDPQNNLTIFQGDLSSCPDNASTPCGSFSELKVEMEDGAKPAFEVQNGGTLILRNLSIVINKGFLAKVSEGGKLEFANVTIKTNVSTPPIEVNSKGNVYLYDEYNQQGTKLGVKYTSDSTSSSFIKIAGSLSEAIKFTKKFDYTNDWSNTYSETDDNKKSGSYFIKNTFDDGKIPIELKDMSKKTCGIAGTKVESSCVADNAKCMRFYKSDDDKKANLSLVKGSSIKNIPLTDLLSSKMICSDGGGQKISFTCKAGTFLQTSGGQLSCSPVPNGQKGPAWEYDSNKKAFTCETKGTITRMKLGDGSCVFGCPYGSTLNAAKTACECDTGREKASFSPSDPKSFFNSEPFICVQTCSEDESKKNKFYDLVQDGQEVWIWTGYVLGTGFLNSSDFASTKKDLENVDKCDVDIGLAKGACEAMDDFGLRIFNDKTGSCLCKTGYNEVDGFCDEEPVCDTASAKVNKSTNKCECKDSDLATLDSNGLSCSCPEWTTLKNGKCDGTARACAKDADCSDGFKCTNNICVSSGTGGKGTGNLCLDDGQVLKPSGTCSCKYEEGYTCSDRDEFDNCICTKEAPTCSDDQELKDGECVPKSVAVKPASGGCMSSIGGAALPDGLGVILPYLVIIIGVRFRKCFRLE